MKKWHLFYLSIITILSYLYYQAAWSNKHFNSIFETNRTLKNANLMLENFDECLFREIEKEAHMSGDTSLRQMLIAKNKISENRRLANEKLREVMSNLYDYSGGIDPSFSDGRMREKGAYFFKPYFLNQAKIEEVKSLYADFEKNNQLILNGLDNRFLNEFRSSPIQNDSIFWISLENISSALALQKLNELNICMKIREMEILRMMYSKASISCMYCGTPPLRLFSNQLNLNDKGYYEGYVSFAVDPFICKTRYYDFYANGKKLKSEGEYGYLRYKPSKKGKNTVKLECSITNPLTGQTERLEREMYFYAN
jgi:hypothetical protein